MSTESTTPGGAGKLCIRRALISVWDKTGIVDFARALHGEFGVEIISTGGTAKALTDAGIPVTLVETLTGCGEMLGGRVKTLHPAIHAAILADRDNPEHIRQLEAAGIKPIDLVVVNLYPFEKTVADPNCSFEQAIEMIDIGGVALLRAAAKNHRHVLVPVYREDLEALLLWIREDALTEEGWAQIRTDYATSAVAATSRYDGEISRWLSDNRQQSLYLTAIDSLRYGENPQQKSTVQQQHADAIARRGLPWADFMLGSGVEMSHSNYLDADAALGLCAELTRAGGHLVRNDSAVVVSSAPSIHSETEQDAARKVWNRPMAGFSPAPLEGSTPSITAPASRSTPPSAGFAAHRKPIGDETFSRRNLPHIQRPGASYFITFRAESKQGGFTPTERDLVMDCCLQPDGELFCLHAAVCMPDHVHLLLTPLETSPGQWRSLTEVMHSIKGNIGRLVAAHRKRQGAVLQDESFDHIIRNEQDLLETLEYIRLNPARAGLESATPYPWVALETAPGWDASTRAAGIDLKHELWAPRVGERAWYSRLAAGVRETQASGSDSFSGSGSGGAERNRPLAGSTLSNQGRSEALTQDAPAGRADNEQTPRACVFIKHTNACGVGVHAEPIEAYKRAYLGDPNAAMGGILVVNFAVDAAFAAAVMETYDRFGKPLKEAGAAYAPGGFFVEVWIAPRFTDDAVAIIRGTYEAAKATPEEGEARVETPPKKKWGENVRLLAVDDMAQPLDPNELQYRSIAGGMLVQSPDLPGLNESEWKVVTKRSPTPEELSDLRLAWLICKHTKSNAISLVKDGRLIGNGAGQMSRVMSCRVATWLARENGHIKEGDTGLVAASDAFFPFFDGPKLLIDAGVTAIIQPGGSKRDQDTVDLCDERGVAMIFTGTRHFRH